MSLLSLLECSYRAGKFLILSCQQNPLLNGSENIEFVVKRHKAVKVVDGVVFMNAYVVVLAILDISQLRCRSIPLIYFGLKNPEHVGRFSHEPLTVTGDFSARG